MTARLIPFTIPPEFVSARVRLKLPEIAFGYRAGWLDAAGVVAIAERLVVDSDEAPEGIIELAMLLHGGLDRVPELLAAIDLASTESWRVWLYLALDWLQANRATFLDVYEIIELLYAEFNYPDEIERLVRFMPVPGGEDAGLDAIDANWGSYVQRSDAQFRERSGLDPVR